MRTFANSGSSSAPAFLEITGTANPFVGIGVALDSSPELGDLDGDGDFDALVGELLIGEPLGRLHFLRSLAADVFHDGFESGDTSSWSTAVP